jgi:two-component system cell cycle sensor histidine kinase/response regulator CckA
VETITGQRIGSQLHSFVERLLPPGEIPRTPRTILVIDDEEGVRMFVSRVLRRAGYSVAVARSGADALHAAEEIPDLDLIIADVVMPEMSGCELARRLRLRNPELKVLYITGYSDRLFEEKVTMWRNEAFVEKPCTPAALLEGVSLLWNQQI